MYPRAHSLGAAQVFAVELVLNMFANWWRPFWSDGWSIFDFLVVSGPPPIPRSILIKFKFKIKVYHVKFKIKVHHARLVHLRLPRRLRSAQPPLPSRSILRNLDLKI